jgi:MFS family permease
MSESKEHTSRRPQVFYGWYVLAASFVLLFVNAGATSIFGLLVKPMQAEFAWSRGAVTSAAFLNLVVYAVAILVTGRLYDRWGPKWVIAGSALLVALGYSLMATVHSLWQFLVYYGVLAAAGFGGTSVPLFGSIMGRWFERRRGLAVSLALAGHSVGQFVLIPLLSSSIAVDGWRSACLWIAGVTLVANLVLSFWVVRGDPASLKMRPYGSDSEASAAAEAARAAATAGKMTAIATPAADLSLAQAMRTRSLWLFTAAMFVCGAGDYLLINHLVAMVTDQGISEAMGASMLAWSGLLGLAAMLAAGPVADAVGSKLPVAVTFALRTALFTMLLLTKGTAVFWVFALGMGFTLPITAPILPTLVGKLYGVRHLGFICGFVTTVHMLGGGLWSYMGGVLFDRTQGYDLMMLISAIASALAVVFTLLIREERHLPR